MILIIIGCIILLIVLVFMLKKNTLQDIPFMFGLNEKKEEYTSPKIFNNFITKQEADLIIKLAKPKMKKSTIRGYEMDKKVRDSETTWLNKELHPLIKKIYQKVSNITNKDENHMENLQVIHYTSSQQFKAHYDQCPRDEAWNIKELTRHKGPRLYTLLIYLNDNYKGGETEFPRLNQKFKLKAGDAVLFHNLDNQEKQVHKDALHSGNPISTGEKWAANIWIRRV